MTLSLQKGVGEMRVQVGLTAERLAVPGGAGFWVEMRKLGGAGRLDYAELLGSGTTTRARFAWDRSVVAYRLPAEDPDGDKSVLKWPVPQNERDDTPTPDEVFLGLDEHFLVWIVAAFEAKHEMLREEYLLLARWIVQDGPEAVPAEAVAARNTGDLPDAEIMAQAKEALIGAPPTIGETLGNSPGSSAGSSETPKSPAPDDAPTSETATPSPES